MSKLQKTKTLLGVVLSREFVGDVKTLAGARLHQVDATCPCCGFVGKFRNFGSPIRLGAMCPKCFSMERQRLLALAVERGFVSFEGRRVLHFAPEQAVRQLVEASSPAEYLASSYPPHPNAHISLNIEKTGLADGRMDCVVCCHVLEHVDDRKALAELYRILGPGGQLVAMVPIIEGWPTTYEDPGKTTETDRRVHFGQYDHVRYYGADFRDRMRDAGFHLDEFWADGADTLKYGLLRGERVFLGTKR